MGHRRATLTPLGRRLLVDRVAKLGWPVSVTAASACPGRRRPRGSVATGKLLHLDL